MAFRLEMIGNFRSQMFYTFKERTDFVSSNERKIKKLYRVGLSHRYGSMMQTVSGIHYNFSYDNHLFEEWAKKEKQTLREFKDKKYLSLVRNFLIQVVGQ